jgi:hypothetical protein
MVRRTGRTTFIPSYGGTTVIKDKEARREYMKQWSRERRKRNHKLLEDYKLERGCQDCGYREHPAALEFDHVIGTKVANVSMLLGQEKKLWEEVAKCEVVCANCHNIRTHNRRT